MTTAGNDTASTRDDELLARVYQQAIGGQAARYAAAYNASAGLARFTSWLQDHAAASRNRTPTRRWPGCTPSTTGRSSG